ncbi:MAG TPA: glycosyltransferase [Fulvivirga sp.]|nr:glycosyltransferase [Fulvivirga sp.]
MSWIIIAILGIYLFWLVIMLFGWLKIDSIYKEVSHSKFFYSIIVPFRNESEHLPTLLNSLSQLNFDRYEIILVNDHSEDDSIQVIAESTIKLKLISLPEGRSGKKAALTVGINAAKGDIIVTTDADCQHHPNWLKVFDYFFNNMKAQMVFGGVALINNGKLFSKLQQVEFAPLIGVGAASLQLGLPTMCNGANLAFRKLAFETVNGYDGNEHIASGDDEFLLAKIHNQFPKQVFYAKQADARVTTAACKTLGEFYNQRKRWASKWSANNGIYKSMLAVLIFCSTGATVAAIFHLFVDYSALLAIALSLKLILDGFLIYSVLKSLQIPFSILIYPLAQILYPIYVLIFGIAANFGNYSWKGRRH